MCCLSHHFAPLTPPLHRTTLCSHREAFLLAYFVAQQAFESRPWWMPRWSTVKIDSFQARELPQMRWQWWEQQCMIVNSPKNDEFGPKDLVAWTKDVQKSFPADQRRAGVNAADLRRSLSPSADTASSSVAKNKRVVVPPAAATTTTTTTKPTTSKSKPIRPPDAPPPVISKKARTVSMTREWKAIEATGRRAAASSIAAELPRRVSALPTRLR